jgi:hypothetical protein
LHTCYLTLPEDLYVGRIFLQTVIPGIRIHVRAVAQNAGPLRQTAIEIQDLRRGIDLLLARVNG